MRILEYLVGEDEPKRLSDIATNAVIPLSTTHSFIQTLLRLEYISASTDRHFYEPGPGLSHLLFRLQDRLTVLSAARPHAANLAAELDEDVYVALVQGDRIVYADRVPGAKGVRLDLPLGVSPPSHASAIGKLHLAMLDDAGLDGVLPAGPLEQYTDHTQTDPSVLRQELKSIRAQGFVVNDSEHYEGVVGVAAPLMGSEDQFLGALSVAVPRGRFQQSRERILLELLKAATKVSRSLGGSNSEPGP
jgi:DNA-binding IclR family transcriptional regulator